MTTAEQLDPSRSVRRVFSDLFFRLERLMDGAEELCEPRPEAQQVTTRQVGNTGLLLVTGRSIETGEQLYYRTLSAALPAGKRTTTRLLTTTKMNPLTRPGSTLEDAVPSKIDLFPRTDLPYLGAYLTRRVARLSDITSWHIINPNLRPAKTKEDVVGLGFSAVGSETTVGDLAVEDASRLSVVRAAVDITVDGIVSVLEGEPVSTMLRGLHTDHTELFLGE